MNTILNFLRKIKRKVLMLRIEILLKFRTRKGFYALDINNIEMGLGARIISAFEILLFCDRHGFQPLIKFDYCEKNKQRANYFGKLFNYINLNKDIPKNIKYTSFFDCTYLPWKKENDLELSQVSLVAAKQLFDKYLVINPIVSDEVDSFTKKWFAGKRVLGLHYRGTDKIVEAPFVPFDELVEKMKEVIEKKATFDLIFISSDDIKIIEKIKELDLNIPVVCREDSIRAEDGVHFHLNPKKSKEVINHEAIVNCLILSRCDFLIKNASLLSDCSMIFNPDLPAIILNFPYEDRLFWPTTEILRNRHLYS